MRKLLITGFEPFGGADINPSWEAVRLLPDTLSGFQLHKLRLPVIFGAAADTVLAAAQALCPDVILCVGQAGGRSAVTPERIAVNIRDARIPDNAGNLPQGEFSVEGGAAAYFSTVPVKAMARAIQDAGLPGTVSNSAGTFVCNDLFYTLLHHTAGTSCRAGFIHVPYLPQQGTPSLSLADTVKALSAAISAL